MGSGVVGSAAPGCVSGGLAFNKVAKQISIDDMINAWQKRLILG
jgi:hypothetical protein